MALETAVGTALGTALETAVGSGVGNSSRNSVRSISRNTVQWRMVLRCCHVEKVQTHCYSINVGVNDQGHMN